MHSFFSRIASRKFLLTIAGVFLVTAFPAQATHIIALIVAFVGAEGAGDVVERYGAEKTKQAHENYQTAKVINMDPDEIKEDIDRNHVTPGIATMDYGTDYALPSN